MSLSAFKQYLKFYGGMHSSGTAVLDKIEDVLLRTKLLVSKKGRISSCRVGANKRAMKELSKKRSIAALIGSRKRAAIAEHVPANEQLYKRKDKKRNKEKKIKQKKVIPVGTEAPLSPRQKARRFFGDPQMRSATALAVSGKYNIPLAGVEKEVTNFTSYWTELSLDGKKQRWELEKTFELPRRLGTWFRNKKGSAAGPKIAFSL